MRRETPDPHARPHDASHDEPHVDAQKPRDVVLEQQAAQATEELERPTTTKRKPIV